MKHVLASAVLATTLLVACTSTNNATPARSAAPSATMATGAHDTRPAFADHLAPLMEQTLRANAIPGAVVLVEKGGQGRWVESFGTSTFGTHAPLGTNDDFRVGSNTKTMTATVILQLVEEGKVRLDDPVGTYVAGVPNGDQITVEQLLSMRSGLPNYTYDPLFVTDPHKAWQPQELLALCSPSRSTSPLVPSSSTRTPTTSSSG